MSMPAPLKSLSLAARMMRIGTSRSWFEAIGYLLQRQGQRISLLSLKRGKPLLAKKMHIYSLSPAEIRPKPGATLPY
jgi:hypothetical protein